MAAAETKNNWTVMFLFAADNELAPLLVSQVKTIRNAGFHRSVDVLVHFDPNERGAPTRLMHVNRKNRKNHPERTSIGIGRDSFVHNMGEDTVRSDDIDGNRGPGSRAMKEALKGPERVTASDALKNFLNYCVENHRAENYMLFLFGHGLVVGNDAFLPDEHPRSAVTLVDLRKILEDFAAAVKNHGKFQLLALHSCAMSAVEVAYELRDTAQFMIGAEGSSYVGSMPYQNLLMKTFNALEDSDKGKDVAELVDKLYFHAMHNCTDFALAGFSLDLALCSLERDRYEPLTADITRLVARLKRALDSVRGREAILLAHWDAQSYWDENYTDLFDFCRRLKIRCESQLGTLDKCLSLLGALGEGGGAGEAAEERERLRRDAEVLRELAAACGKVTGRLKPKNEDELGDWGGPIILQSTSVGHKYQYSHGLSVYFPWSTPLADEPAPALPVALQSRRRATAPTAADALARYAEYAFSGKEFGDDSWLSFLKDYFVKTRRDSRKREDKEDRLARGVPLEEAEPQERAGTVAAIVADLSHAFHLAELSKPTGEASKPTGESGSTCSCPSIKNYETEIFAPDRRKPNEGVEVKAFFISDELLRRDAAPPDE